MTFIQAKTLKEGDVIYCVDSIGGSYPCIVTEENGHTGGIGSSYPPPKVSISYLFKEYDMGDGYIYSPYRSYMLTYEEACQKEMPPYWYWNNSRI